MTLPFSIIPHFVELSTGLCASSNNHTIYPRTWLSQKFWIKLFVTIIQNPDDPGIKAFQLLIHTVGERDYSAQETCHLLLQLPLYHCSRNFVCLNLNKETNQWLHDSEQNTNNENNETKKTVLSLLQRYCSRPTELSDLSLFRITCNTS